MDKFQRKKKEEVKENNKRREKLDSRCDKKVVYNNSSRVLSEKEIELLSLGLKFGLTPKKFPLVEYISATEMLCKSLEQTDQPDAIEKAQAIRNLMLSHIRNGYLKKMTIKSNLSAEEKEILRELKNDESIIICSADKGKAVDVEDTETYMSKVQQQINEGDYELAKGNEKTLLRKLHFKLVAQLKSMGLTEFKGRRPFLLTAPVMAISKYTRKTSQDE